MAAFTDYIFHHDGFTWFVQWPCSRNHLAMPDNRGPGAWQWPGSGGLAAALAAAGGRGRAPAVAWQGGQGLAVTWQQVFYSGVARSHIQMMDLRKNGMSCSKEL